MLSISCCAPRTSVAWIPPSIQTTALPSAARARAWSSDKFSAWASRSEISKRLAHAENLSEDQARALAAEGKAVVWIDGGIHATEVLGAQQLIESIYQLVSRTDAE